MVNNGWYADVILPVPLPVLYTYAIPPDLVKKIKPGIRARVQLGNKNYYSAIIKSVHQNRPDTRKIKCIISLLDNEEIISRKQFKFWEWLSEYYMCTEGEIMNAALPVGLRSPEIYKEKTGTFIKHKNQLNENEFNQVLDKLKKAPAQYKILINYIDISGLFSGGEINPVKKKKLLEISGSGQASLNALIKKDILYIYKSTVSRLEEPISQLTEPSPLNQKQTKVIQDIRKLLPEKKVVLLHGITSSGKTEIYIHLIKEQLKKAKQVLYLLPEISVTTQIITRLKKVFGTSVGIYHSRLSNSERVEIWNNVKARTNDSYQIILGVRSSVFIPFSDLGLIIIDEEHENSYKQQDPAPRYNARDAAIMLARIHGASTLLGTATPSLESYYNAKSGKYGLVELKHRYGEASLPEVILANTREARRKKKMRSIFTPMMYEGIKNCLEKGEQIILFQNRRGYSPYLECENCGWIPKCSHCDVSLTYHKYFNKLICHYCGNSYGISNSCKKCDNELLVPRGSGTEKIEEEISIFFPEAKIARMDFDSTRSKRAFENIINDFRQKRTNILIGTQMLSKGFDFDHVSLTGIMNADNMLNFPDFRSFERSYQLMVQVSGRAGRKNLPGKVIIQTSDPKHHIIKYISNNDYESMFNSELIDRKNFTYPPYSRLIRIQLKHKNKILVHNSATKLVSMLSDYFQNNVLGPETPVISKIQSYYIKNILIKIEREKSKKKAKNNIRQNINSLKKTDEYKSVLISTNVDPL